MNPRSVALFGAMVFSIGGIAFFLRLSGWLAAPSARREPLTCRFTPGERLGFRLQATSDVSSGAGGAPQHLELSARMTFEVLEERPAGGFVVAAALDTVRLAGDASQGNEAERVALQAPFLLQIGRDCRFRDFRFEAETRPEAQKQLQGLLQSVELVLPALPQTQWVARQRDDLGAFDASYLLDATSGQNQESGPLVTRRRTRYHTGGMAPLPSQLGGNMSVALLSSKLTATFDAKGRWVRRASGNERLRIAMGDKQLAEVASTIELSRTADEGRPPTALVGLDRARFLGAAQKSQEPVLPPPPDSTLAARDLDGAVDEFASALGPRGDRYHDAAMRLASYLGVHPEAISALLSRIKSGAIDAKLVPTLFLALEKTGTIAAERALAAALSDPDLSALNRSRAAAALADIPRPSENTARTLIEQARGGGAGGAEREVAATALLSLGALSHRTAARQPQVARLAHDAIAERLSATREPAEINLALDAIGNSGDRSFTESLKRYTDDPSATVRAHAAQAHRRMERAAMEPVLIAWLSREPEAEVRRAIGDALEEKLITDGRPASPALCAAAAARLPVETDGRVRASLIALLGTAVASDVGAKQSLVQQFGREPDPDLKALIGRFVGAEELP